MSKTTRKKVVSILGATSDMTRNRFMARYQCCTNNPDVLSALAAGQLPEETDLAVRVHVLNCDGCRREYLKLKTGKGDTRKSLPARKPFKMAGVRIDRENVIDRKKSKSGSKAS